MLYLAMVDSCGVHRLLFSVDLTSDRLLSDLMWFVCRSWQTRYVEFGSFRKLIGFSASHVYAPINSKVQHPPPGQPPWHLNF